MRVFYEKKDTSVGRVISIDNDVDFSQIPERPFIDIEGTIPTAERTYGCNYILMVDLETKKLFYDYSEMIYLITGDEYQREIFKIHNSLISERERFEKFRSTNIKLIELKKIKIAALKETCNQQILDGFYSTSLNRAFGFNKLDQENFSQQLLMIVRGSIKENDIIKWKTLDGSILPLKLEQFLTLISESSVHKISCQHKYWSLEKQVNEATTNLELYNIEW